MTRLALALLAVPFVCAAETGRDPRQTDTHRDWASYVVEGDEGKVCYIASEPLESSPDMEGRTQTWVLVTHRPAANVKDEVGVIAGYPYQPGTQVHAIIDTEKYELFTQGDGAWLRTPEEEAAVVAAMKKGRVMTLVGYSSSGVTTTDKYSLLGFTAAHRAIGQECGLD